VENSSNIAPPRSRRHRCIMLIINELSKARVNHEELEEHEDNMEFDELSKSRIS